MSSAFAHRVRVRYAECDVQGVVFNAHYLAYLDLSMTELWRAAIGSYGAMTARGVDIVVAEVALRFLGPARFDDELTLEVEMAGLGTTSLSSTHRIRREGEVLVTGTMRHVLVSLETMQKTPIPDWLREGLEPWTVSGLKPGPTKPA